MRKFPNLFADFHIQAVVISLKLYSTILQVYVYFVRIAKWIENTVWYLLAISHLYSPTTYNMSYETLVLISSNELAHHSFPLYHQAHRCCSITYCIAQHIANCAITSWAIKSGCAAGLINYFLFWCGPKNETRFLTPQNYFLIRLFGRWLVVIFHQIQGKNLPTNKSAAAHFSRKHLRHSDVSLLQKRSSRQELRMPKCASHCLYV